MNKLHHIAPKTIALVAMGKSAGTYINMCSTKGDRRLLADETWAINAMGGVIKHDLLFHMDDCKIQESRAVRQPDGNVAGILRWLRNHPRFITSKAYDDYPGAIEFPLQDVMNAVGVSYFNNTVAYAIAYAMYLGVGKISLFGVDFSYENDHKAERGRGCVEFLLGMAAARGIEVEVGGDSTLLDANVDPKNRFYGYDANDIELKYTDAGVEVLQTPREVLPTAEEIEKRYRFA
jgi:hypothetical protein